jgi:hypothetical protein
MNPSQHVYYAQNTGSHKNLAAIENNVFVAKSGTWIMICEHRNVPTPALIWTASKPALAHFNRTPICKEKPLQEKPGSFHSYYICQFLTVSGPRESCETTLATDKKENASEEAKESDC